MNRTFPRLSLTLVLAALPAAVAGQERTTLPILDPVTLRASCEYALEDARARTAALESLPLAQASVETVLDVWDGNSVAMEDIVGPVAILNNVHPDPRVREAAEECIRKVSSYETELYQNAALYERVAAVRTDDPVAAQLREDLLEYFEDTGVNLPVERRARAKEIDERLTELRQEFERNIRDDTTRLVFTPEEYDGVPHGYLEQVERDANGNIVVGMDSPDYVPFMRNAVNEEARRRYYIAYQNVAAPRNIEILEEISTLRRELARLHGQPSYADHVIRRRMAGDREAVSAFLDEVRQGVTSAERAELEEIRALKAELTGKSLAETELHHWDLGFYRERLRERRYSIDQEELRRYFPTEPALDWALELSSRLYGVTFAEVEVPVWHPDVRYFDVLDDETGEFLGGFYADVYPRPGKYNHAAVWPVRKSSSLAGRRPISVLVTNFDRRGLTHGEVETMLHELGHALHNIFSQTRYALHGGTAVEMDFVEAPSQMYEEWARRPETLAVMQEVCTACPPIEPELVDRLNAARRFGQGLAYADQRMLAAYDQALTGPQPVEIMGAWRMVEGETSLGSVPGTHFPAQFGHLANHYGAGYYGYMWSEVIALDLLSAFERNLLDEEVGRRFRNTVLSRGGERPAMDLVEEFLGREVSREAFFEEISGQRR